MRRNHSKERVLLKCYPQFLFIKITIQLVFKEPDFEIVRFLKDFRCYSLLYVISLYFRLYLIFFSLSLVFASNQFKNIPESSKIVLKCIF